MNLFLKLKHWQLFGLVICTYLAFQIAGTTTVSSSQGVKKTVTEQNYFGFKKAIITTSQETTNELSTISPSIVSTFKVTIPSPIVILLIAIFFGWFYSVGVNLKKKLPPTVKMSLTKFKLVIYYLIAYIFIFFILMYVLFYIVNNGSEPNFSFLKVIIPFHLFSMFCILYCIYFIAKSLKSIDLQRNATSGEYAGEFFLILFFPIGIWIIQPKINKMFDETL